MSAQRGPPSLCPAFAATSSFILHSQALGRTMIGGQALPLQVPSTGSGQEGEELYFHYIYCSLKLPSCLRAYPYTHLFSEISERTG